MREIGFAFALVLVAGCGATIQPSYDVEEQPLVEGWEAPDPPLATIEDCDQIESALIHPVSPSMRDQSIATLADVSVVELSDIGAARLIDAPQPGNSPLAATLIASFIDEMRARKHRAEVERRDSWSRADENVLVAVSARFAAGEFRAYRPYLVQAVAKHEATGGFYADLCGGDLHILHGSLGRSTPPSTRVPLVIFLGQQPQRVFATSSIAE